tara:strand:- start:5665 stop:6834 length:1170 start_codon:yes stop_codon:yes gene_type:complete
MAINFPATGGQPTDGSFTYTVAGITYSWNGESWTAAGAGASATDRTLFSVNTNAASGTSALSYDSNTGVFDYTPSQPEDDTFNDVVGRGNTALQDVIFGDYTGATGAPKIQYVDSNSTLWFKCPTVAGDSAILQLGNGISYNNLTIQTSASLGAAFVTHHQNLFLSTYTSGYNIVLQSSNDIYLQNGSQNAIKVLDNNQTNGDALSVELYWGSATTGGKKLETTTNGVTITGALTAGGLTYPNTNGNPNEILTSDGAGNVTWGTAAGLQVRQTVSVAGTITGGAFANSSANMAKTVALLSIQSNSPAWVVLYADTASRTADANRNRNTSPAPGSGVLAEVIFTTAGTQLLTPGVFGFSPGGGTTYYTKITNDGSTGNVSVDFTYVQLEA